MSKLFADALKFLDERELSWRLNEPINKREYLLNLIESMVDKSLAACYKQDL